MPDPRFRSGARAVLRRSRFLKSSAGRNGRFRRVENLSPMVANQGALTKVLRFQG